MNIEEIKYNVIHNLKVMEIINPLNEIEINEIIDKYLINQIDSIEAEIFLKSKLSNWYSIPYFLVRDIFRLCEEFQGKPIPNSDLGLEWFKIVGSDLTNTRPMCLEMKKRKFFHVFEIPELIKGIVDGRQIPLDERAFPDGFFPCINEFNYLRFANGRSCGHSFNYVSTVIVPENIKRKIKKKFK